MPERHNVSRRGLRLGSTTVHIGSYGGIGTRRQATMNARRVDRLFAMNAPNVVFPNPTRNSERQPISDSLMHDMGSYPIGSLDPSGFAETGEIAEGESPQNAPLIEIFQYKNRSNVGVRKRLSEQWKATEEVLTQLLHNGSVTGTCPCTGRDHVQVRLISLESWTVKSVDYCNCPLSTSSLVAEGFFPSTPRKPRTAFSLRLLKVLHEQSVRGSISKVAWADGLRVVYEHDLKAPLPGFSRQVSRYLDIAPPRVLYQPDS